MIVRPGFRAMLEAHEADIITAVALLLITLTFHAFILV